MINSCIQHSFKENANMIARTIGMQTSDMNLMIIDYTMSAYRRCWGEGLTIRLADSF